MTNFDENWVAAEEAKRQWMNDNGLYRAEEEHSSCGVGLVVSIDGSASRGVVQKGIDALLAMVQVSTSRFQCSSFTTKCAARATNLIKTS
jgi:hypothetical protein